MPDFFASTNRAVSYHLPMPEPAADPHLPETRRVAMHALIAGIIPGIIIIIGLFWARWSMKTIIPSEATIMTPGRTF